MPGSTNYPAAIDAFILPDAGAGDALNTPGVVHDAVHGSAFLAIEALETKVGVTGSAVPTSDDYRLGQLETIGLVQRPHVVGASGSLVGGAVPSVTTTQFREQFGFDTPTTDGNAAWNTAFPVAFPAGVVCVMMTADSANGLISVVTYQPNCTLALFEGLAIGPGGILLRNTTISVAWRAIGW